jgi:predicted nucleic acid-binding Zn ribbon protein
MKKERSRIVNLIISFFLTLVLTLLVGIGLHILFDWRSPLFILLFFPLSLWVTYSAIRKITEDQRGKILKYMTITYFIITLALNIIENEVPKSLGVHNPDDCNSILNQNTLCKSIMNIMFMLILLFGTLTLITGLAYFLGPKIFKEIS